eukprot:5082401-Prymnesium_polylepis.1
MRRQGAIGVGIGGLYAAADAADKIFTLNFRKASQEMFRQPVFPWGPLGYPGERDYLNRLGRSGG